MLQLLARPLAATLLVVLPALLLERLLRLFDLVAGSGAFGQVIQLVLYLTPHYAGLALPAAVFASVFIVVARLAEHHELDALQGAGVSLTRISRPFLMMGLLLAIGGLGLYGHLQPLGRYAYRAALHSVMNTRWNATVVPGEFSRIGERLTVTADRVAPETGELRGIFIEQQRPDGAHVTTTARSGWLTTRPAEGELALELADGSQIAALPGERVETLAFGGSSLTRPFSIILTTYRARGEDERELTLGELWSGPVPGGNDIPKGRWDGELHGRLVRAFSLALLPLLAVPMGLGAKRTRRWHGIALSALILVIYHHAVQLVESLGDIGAIAPMPTLWGVFVLFAVFSVLIFRHASRHPHEGPFDGLLAMLERGTDALAARLPRRRQPT